MGFKLMTECLQVRHSTYFSSTVVTWLPMVTYMTLYDYLVPFIVPFWSVPLLNLLLKGVRVSPTLGVYLYFILVENKCRHRGHILTLSSFLQ